jgi:hypothetical protein
MAYISITHAKLGCHFGYNWNLVYSPSQVQWVKEPHVWMAE